MIPRLLNAKEVAELLSIRVEDVWLMSAKGLFPTQKLGRRSRFREEDIQEFLDQQYRKAVND